MGTFRGIGDDALTVIERHRQASQRSAQLGEQRRSNMAGEAIARERIDLAQQQAESSAVTEERKLGVEQDRNAIYRQQADTATVNAKTSQVNASREAMLAKQVYDKNERVFQQTKKTWEAEEAQRAQAQKLAQTAFSGVIRAAAFSPGSVPQTFVTAYNMSIGVADGAPKSMLRALTIKDPKTGMAQAIGYETVGDDGKPVRNLVLPEQFWAAIEGVYGGETAKMLFTEYSKRYTENSPMYAAGAKRVAKFDKGLDEALTAAKTETTAARTTALRTDLPVIDAKLANIDKLIEENRGLVKPAADAAGASGWGTPPANPDKAANTRTPQPFARMRKDGKIEYMDDKGTVYEKPDSPKLRADLASVGVKIEGVDEKPVADKTE